MYMYIWYINYMYHIKLHYLLTEYKLKSFALESCTVIPVRGISDLHIKIPLANTEILHIQIGSRFHV